MFCELVDFLHSDVCGSNNQGHMHVGPAETAFSAAAFLFRECQFDASVIMSRPSSHYHCLQLVRSHGEESLSHVVKLFLDLIIDVQEFPPSPFVAPQLRCKPCLANSRA